MFDHDRKDELNQILNDVAKSLDVPPSKYEEATARYKAVGDWLGADDSPLAVYDPVIAPQGSFAHGTAVSPLGDDDYDVDSVVNLSSLHYSDTTQRELKDLVGDRLKEPKSRYRRMLDPPEGSKRCWTIKYAGRLEVPPRRAPRRSG